MRDVGLDFPEHAIDEMSSFVHVLGEDHPHPLVQIDVRRLRLPVLPKRAAFGEVVRVHLATHPHDVQRPSVLFSKKDLRRQLVDDAAHLVHVMMVVWPSVRWWSVSMSQAVGVWCWLHAFLLPAQLRHEAVAVVSEEMHASCAAPRVSASGARSALAGRFSGSQRDTRTSRPGV